MAVKKSGFQFWDRASTIMWACDKNRKRSLQEGQSGHCIAALMSSTWCSRVGTERIQRYRDSACLLQLQRLEKREEL